MLRTLILPNQFPMCYQGGINTKGKEVYLEMY